MERRRDGVVKGKGSSEGTHLSDVGDAETVPEGQLVVGVLPGSDGEPHVLVAPAGLDLPAGILQLVRNVSTIPCGRLWDLVVEVGVQYWDLWPVVQHTATTAKVSENKRLRATAAND
jgi:hypothetical protein